MEQLDCCCNDDCDCFCDEGLCECKCGCGIALHVSCRHCGYDSVIPADENGDTAIPDACPSCGGQNWAYHKV